LSNRDELLAYYRAWWAYYKAYRDSSSKELVTERMQVKMKECEKMAKKLKLGANGPA
jgi:hypothetical protein